MAVERHVGETLSEPGDLRTPAETAVGHVIEEIKSRIMTGRLTPGQRLIEAELTQELNVSRGPLREALAQLAVRGLVELRPHRSAVIRRITRKELGESTEIAAVLEPIAAKLAAERLTDEGRRRMTSVVSDSDPGAAGNMHHAIRTNTRFHELVLELSGHAMLLEFGLRIHATPYRLLYHNALPMSYRRQSLGQHREVGEAILAGDAELAAELMRSHDLETRDALLGLPDSMFA